jgi:hypothetical protein
MADSDDDYNSTSHGNNLTSNVNNYHNNGNNNSNYNNLNSNKNRNRDKFYRERDNNNDTSSSTTTTTTAQAPSSNNNYYNNNYNRNNERRDWNSNDRNNSRGGGHHHDSSWNNNRHHSSTYNNQNGYNNRSNSGDNRSNNSSSTNRRDLSMDLPSRSNYNSYDHHQSAAAASADPEYPTQPPFLTFKQFLQQQDDNISDDDALRKYNDYKINFKRTQINNFFLEHKEEEWFKSRYHPDESHKRRRQLNEQIIHRLQVFMDLINESDGKWLQNVSCQLDKSKELIKFLDAVVIKLENGTEDDLNQLNIDEEAEPTSNNDDIKLIEPKNTDDNDNKPETNTDKDESNGKRKAEDSGSESGAYSNSDNEDDTKKSERKKKKLNNGNTKAATTTKTNQGQLHKTASIFMRNLAPSVTKEDIEKVCSTYDGFKRIALSDPAPERGFYRRGWITFEPQIDVKKICWNLQSVKFKESNHGAILNRELTNRIRPISNLVSHHRTVMKNDIKLAMKIIQNMDKRWNIFQQQQQQQHQNDDKMNDVSMKQSTENENQTAEEIEKKENQSEEDTLLAGSVNTEPKHLPHNFNGPNPLFENIADFLVDEADAEEEELLGVEKNDDSNENEKESSKNKEKSSFDIEIDQKYSNFLDKLILYLRVVHSIDYYQSIEYQQEDQMPNRCGIMFVRPSLPLNAASASLKVTQDDVDQYITQFTSKMKPYVEYKEELDTEMATKLGMKVLKNEVEKFIQTNTEELAPDRWLCPLSGKKFKGPEFIRKHLFYKHMDKINEVKKEVIQFSSI